MDNDEQLDNIKPETSFEVQLYIYDLSRGLAQTLLSQLLGKNIPAIYHTSIVAYGREYFYGGLGIESCDPGATVLGEPQQIVQLGVTEIPYQLFLEYIFGLGSSTYANGTYDLFHHNCNNFTNELANFLFGKGIPEEIIKLPHEILDTPLGKTLAGFLNSFNIRPPGQGAQLSGAPQSQSSYQRREMAESNTAANNTESSGNADEETYVPSASKRKVYKYSDTPITYKDVDANETVKKLTDLVNDKLTAEEQLLLKEWSDFITQDNGGWSLGDEHIVLFRKILENEKNQFNDESAGLIMKVLQTSALRDGFVLLLHQDRKDHRLMSYLNKIEQVELNQQEEICKFAINLCGLPSSFDWLMYISEWFEDDGQSSSNCRVTIRIAVHCLLHEKLKSINQHGLNLIWNIALREVFDDTAIELSTALLQYLHSDLSEENVHLALTALSRFLAISANDIAMLAKMIGPNIDKFKGVSERNDKLIQEVTLKIGGSTASSI